MRPRPSEITAAVERAYCLADGILRTRSNKPEICTPRQVAMWIMHRHGMSHSHIGQFFGKHHTTSIHSVNKIEALIADEEITWVIQSVEKWWISKSAERKLVAL